jgi:GntR family transcriptional regulator
MRRLLLRGEQPVVLDEIWLPAAPFKGLTAERLSGYRGPMYGYFEAEFGVRMIRAEEKIRAVAAAREAAQLLAVAAGAPLLSVERLSLHLWRQAGGTAPRALRHQRRTTIATS